MNDAKIIPSNIINKKRITALAILVIAIMLLPNHHFLNSPTNALASKDPLEYSTVLPAKVSTTDNLEIIEQLGGVSSAIEVVNDIAFVGLGPRIVTLDVSDPNEYVVIAKSFPMLGVVIDIKYSNNHLFVVTYSGVYILNVENPYLISYVSVIYRSSTYPPNNLLVLGNTLFIPHGRYGLGIYDITNPTNPTEIANYAGNIVDIEISGNYAYLADFYSGLRILDISDLTNIIEVDFQTPFNTVSGVSKFGTQLFVKAARFLKVFDISIPNTPVEIGDYVNGININELIAYDSHIYLSAYNRLSIVDFSDLDNILVVGVLETNEVISKLKLNGNSLFMALNSSGVITVDVSDISQPFEIASYDEATNITSIVIDSDYLYAISGYGGLDIYDITTPTQPILVKNVETEEASGLDIQGNLAFLVDKSLLRIIDIVDPTSPRDLGNFNFSSCGDGAEVGIDVEVMGDYAFVVVAGNGYQGICVIDISNPATLQRVSLYGQVAARHLTIVDHLVYVSTVGGSGYVILDASNPAQLIRLGQYQNIFSVYYSVVKGNVAYLATYSPYPGGGSLVTLDISDPTSPVYLGAYTRQFRHTSKLDVVGNYAFVGFEIDGFGIYDVSIPTKPIEVGSLHGTELFRTSSNDLKYVNGVLYVANGGSGLIIVDFQPSYNLANDLNVFVREANENIKDIAYSATDAAIVGDYFLDQIPVDRANLVIDMIFNSFHLGGVNWGLSKRIGNVFTPGYPALHATWQGWTDNSRSARHFYKPLYDSIYNDRQLVYNQVLRSGFRYFAEEAGQSVYDESVKEWLKTSLVPSPANSINDDLGLPAVMLGGDYRSQITSKNNELLDELPQLALSPEQVEEYHFDLRARQYANEQLYRQTRGHRDYLWRVYQNRLADETNFLRNFNELAFKWGVIGGATLAADGPGFYVASTGWSIYETLYDHYRNIQNLMVDESIWSQSVEFITNRVSQAYIGISSNTINGLNMIQNGIPPQIAKGEIGRPIKNSYGHYRLWPNLWWVETKSEILLPITNNSNYPVTYQTSIAFQHNNFWTGTERLLMEGESLDLQPNTQDTASIILNFGEYGVSPEKSSLMNVLVLGATDTGLYPIKEWGVYWNPNRIDTSLSSSLFLTSNYTQDQLDEAPTFPYPLSQSINPNPNTTEHVISFLIHNPFSIQVRSTLIQEIPLGVEVVDLGGAQQTGNTLLWDEELAPSSSVRHDVKVSFQAQVGNKVLIPAPSLEFKDLVSGEGDIYIGSERSIEPVWPIEVMPNFPEEIQRYSSISLPIEVRNISLVHSVQGEFRLQALNLSGSEIGISNITFNLSSNSNELFSIPIQTQTNEDYLVLRGEVVIGNKNVEAFYELVPVSGTSNFLFLPILIR